MSARNLLLFVPALMILGGSSFAQTTKMNLPGCGPDQEVIYKEGLAIRQNVLEAAKAADDALRAELRTLTNSYARLRCAGTSGDGGTCAALKSSIAATRGTIAENSSFTSALAAAAYAYRIQQPFVTPSGEACLRCKSPGDFSCIEPGLAPGFQPPGMPKASPHDHNNPLLGDWHCPGRLFTFTQEGNEIVGRWTVVDPTSANRDKRPVNEAGYRMRQTAPNQYTGETLWRDSAGRSGWKPTTITVNGNTLTNSGGDACSTTLTRAGVTGTGTMAGSVSTGALGNVWSESEAGFSGTWTRRPGTNIFDGFWSGVNVRAVLEVSYSGNQVTVHRSQGSDGYVCDYTGTLNGYDITGTFGCNKNPGPIAWRATIQR